MYALTGTLMFLESFEGKKGMFEKIPYILGKCLLYICYFLQKSKYIAAKTRLPFLKLKGATIVAKGQIRGTYYLAAECDRMINLEK